MPLDLSFNWEQLNAEHLAGIVHTQTVPVNESVRNMGNLSGTAKAVQLGVAKLFIIKASPISRFLHAHPH